MSFFTGMNHLPLAEKNVVHMQVSAKVSRQESAEHFRVSRPKKDRTNEF